MPEERKSTPDEQKHRQGVVLFNQGSYDQAARLFAEALDIQETSDCWNDWATAEMLCERGPSGERGFRYALDLNPHNQQAAANLGIFLAGLDRHAEAIALLEQPLEGVDQQQRDAIAQLLTNCREKLATGESADAGVPAEGQPEAHAEASEGPTSSPEDVEGSEGPRLNNASQPAAQAELAQPQNREQVIAAVNSVSKWWHTIELPFGLTTPGVIDYRNVVDKWGLPSDLTGKTVLDIGCWDGFWSFEAEKRGPSACSPSIIGLKTFSPTARASWSRTHSSGLGWTTYGTTSSPFRLSNMDALTWFFFSASSTTCATPSWHWSASRSSATSS